MTMQPFQTTDSYQLRSLIRTPDGVIHGFYFRDDADWHAYSVTHGKSGEIKTVYIDGVKTHNDVAIGKPWAEYDLSECEFSIPCK